METHGEVLGAQNKEFVKSIADLKSKRSELQTQIHDDEALKIRIEQQIETVRRRIAQLTDSIHRRCELKDGYNKVIGETEMSYNKILEESENLLGILHTSTNHFDKINHGGYDHETSHLV